MKRNSLTTAVVAGIAGVAGFAGLANAVDLNPDGLGQVLIYPYYTVNAGQDTLFSVVNTADVGKAVKVRFLEGYNSREVLDFNLFLSAHDVWTTVVTQVSDDGGGQINTDDRSCIDPSLTFPYPFSASGYNGDLAPGQPADSGPQGLDRTREGYLEIIAMGDIIPGSNLEAAITHEQGHGPDGGIPDCGIGSDDAAIQADLVAPTSGLFGAGAVVNVAAGTLFGYNADAIDGFTETTLYTGPGELLPSLTSANTPSLAAVGVARAYVFTQGATGLGGALLAADYTRGIDAVSAIFMADAVYNEYLVNANVGAATDWVLTFPTKRFYVDKGLFPSPITQPFAQPFAAGKSEFLVGLVTYDREEGHGTLERCPSPPGPNCFVTNPKLPWEVNVLGFQTSSVLGSGLYRNIQPYSPTAGWANMNLFNPPGETHQLSGGTTSGGAAVVLNGLPVTGFMGYNIINANVTAGVLSNYSGVFRHRAHRSCGAGQTDPACS
jgi:hypothetical protein